MFKLTAAIYVDPNDEADDPEDIATQMNEGLGEVLAGFPGGEIALAKVETIEAASDEDIRELGLHE